VDLNLNLGILVIKCVTSWDGPYSQGYEYDVWGNVTHKYGWGGEVQGGGAGQSSDIYYSYTGNRRNGFSYDAAGNVTNDLGQTFTYDVTGQQTQASYSGYSLQQSYDGDGLRVKKSDNGVQTYYLRSSVLGGQVVAEINWFSVAWGWNRGYVYVGSQLLAVQQSASVNWMHEDPVTKSKRVTNSAGAVISMIETDPWGADTNRSSNSAFQPKKFTTYERDANGTDEAMFRRYNRWQSRFDQPDPYDGSYDLGDPQSFNRYAYVQGDPVNFVDPTGLVESWNCVLTDHGYECGMTVPVSWADELWAGTGGPPEFGGPIIHGDPAVGGGGSGHEAGHGPQKTTGTQQETKECADMRAKLLGDPMMNSALDDVWNRSQASPQHTKQEEGGLLGRTGGAGLNVDSVFTRQGKLTAALEGFNLWADRKIRHNRGTVTYEFWYHSHPHDEFEIIPGEGTQGTPDFPSPDDLDVSRNLGLLGILVSKKHIVVFDKDGFIRCHFDR